MKLERKVEILLHGTASFAHAHEQQACIHSYGRISLISAEENKACQDFARDLEILGKNLTIEKMCPAKGNPIESLHPSPSATTHSYLRSIRIVGSPEAV